MPSMLPLLFVALLIWGGILVFLFVVDRKVSSLEQKLEALSGSREEARR